MSAPPGLRGASLSEASILYLLVARKWGVTLDQTVLVNIKVRLPNGYKISMFVHCHVTYLSPLCRR
jgi:hypothetical protein